MMNEQEVMLTENPKRPLCFWHFVNKSLLRRREPNIQNYYKRLYLLDKHPHSALFAPSRRGWLIIDYLSELYPNPAVEAQWLQVHPGHHGNLPATTTATLGHLSE